MRIPTGSRNLNFYPLLTAALIVPTFLWPEFRARTWSTQGFRPHSYRPVWPPSVIWLHTGSDLGIDVFHLRLAAILSVLLRRADREILFHWAISTMPPWAAAAFSVPRASALRDHLLQPSTAAILNSVGGHSRAGGGAPVNAALPIFNAPS